MEFGAVAVRFSLIIIAVASTPVSIFKSIHLKSDGPDFSCPDDTNVVSRWLSTVPVLNDVSQLKSFWVLQQVLSSTCTGNVQSGSGGRRHLRSSLHLIIYSYITTQASRLYWHAMPHLMGSERFCHNNLRMSKSELSHMPYTHLHRDNFWSPTESESTLSSDSKFNLLLSDHKPLRSFFKESSGISTYWHAGMLAAYDYHINYKAGLENANADLLGQLPLPGTPIEIPEASCKCWTTASQISDPV